MGPLEGLRIVEFGGLGPGPFCGMLLSDLGAEVTLVERSGGITPLGMAPGSDITRRGKRSVLLDLKRPEAIELALRLVERSDGLIEGYRPGVMERLGLGPDACLARNPRLAYGRVTGWGQTGPLAQSAGHDLNYVALSGALFYSGRRGSPPISPPTLVGDVGGGALFLALGLVSAMLRARATGAGQVIDAAITDGSALMTSLLYGAHQQGLWSDQREANALDGGAFWYDCYECADGHWISIGALEPQFYRLLLEKLDLAGQGLEDAQFDCGRWPALKQRFAEIFRSRSRAEWSELLSNTDVCFAPVLDFREAAAHPHNRARATYVDRHGLMQPAPAPRFSATPSCIGPAPAEVGAHTREVLEALGCSAAQIGALTSGAQSTDGRR